MRKPKSCRGRDAQEARRPFGPSRLVHLVSALLVVAVAGAASEPADAQLRRKDRAKIEKLAPRFQEFLIEADALLEKKARKEFLRLKEDYQRDDFIKAFWEALDPDPRTPENEFRDQWLARVEETIDVYGTSTSDRARIYLLNGPPNDIIEKPCEFALWPLEIWVYQSAEQVGHRIVSVFVDSAMGGDIYRLWLATDDPQRLLRTPISQLLSHWDSLSGDEKSDILSRLAWWLDRAASMSGNRFPVSLNDLNPSNLRCPEFDYGCRSMRDGLLMFFIELMNSCDPRTGGLLMESVAIHRYSAFAQAKLTVPSGDFVDPERLWLERFRDAQTELPDDADPLEASMEIGFPGSHLSRTVVEARLQLPRASAGVRESEPAIHHFEINAEVLRGDELFDRLRLNYELPIEPDEADAEQPIELSFQQYLRPGEYQLVVLVRDMVSGGVDRLETELVVPKVDQPIEQPDGELTDILSEVAEQLEAELEQASAVPVVQLSPKDEEQYSGYVRFTAELEETAAENVKSVEFWLDGSRVLAKRRAPFSAEMDLGELPRPHTVEARALDADGQELGRDVFEVNRGRHSFRVRMVEPADGQKAQGTVPVRVDVGVPSDTELERVELLLDDKPVTTWSAPPFRGTIDIPSPGIHVVRSVAYLADGNSTEDLVLVNTPGETERVRVQFVEMYASIKKGGTPFLDLERDQVTLLENGEPQQIVRFERVEDLPLHLCFLMDTSGSMTERLIETREMAADFFAQSVRPKDRVCVMSFAEYPTMRVDFTNDLEQMNKGLRYLAAGRGTAFYDAIVYALYQLQGLKGQRALFVLSDGQDRNSRFDVERALEYARRAGVTIYSMSLQSTLKSPVSRRKLAQFADETGGRAIFVKELSELAQVYRDVERELRSRYLIAYQSTTDQDDLAYREIELRVNEPGVEVVAMRGYYP